MDCSSEGFVDSSAIELPVLQPPPGFEDGSPFVVEDHLYDDPYCEDIELDFKPTLNIQAVSSFADNLSQSILASVVESNKPRVKLRTKKPLAIPQQQQQQTLKSECDFYSVPIDSLNEDKRQQLETNRSMNRHSIAVPRNTETSEPIHMTLEEVRSYLREFQDTSSSQRRRPWMIVPSKSVESTTSDSKRKSCFVWTPHLVTKNNSFDDARTKRSRKSLSVTAAGIKQALFSVFRISTQHHFLSHQPHDGESSRNQVCPTGWTFSTPDKSETHQLSSAGNSPHQRRALPPVPQEPVGFVRVPSRPPPPVLSPPPTSTTTGDIQHLDLAGSVPNCGSSNSFETPVNCLSEGSLDLADNHNHQESALDFAASIEAVKDHGWYWGPLSGDAAEKILSTEPDGSFLVRDSSDDHYIFSLSFKLNGGVRHVRIEHDHGNFSFGSVARFRSQTMVEFIDKAIEHSRSGRFLFFLHRRPTHGPTRVQLLHPVSRFRQVQSLQHLSRFVILKFVRRDQISLLPLPTRLREYLNTAHYYSEQLVNGTTSHHSP